METITIPETIEEAVTELGGLGQLLTAKGWQRAATVYAFTRDGKRGPRAQKTLKLESLTCDQFAKLGIHGLQSAQTVREHRANWQEAIDRGWATAIHPGETVVLPSTDYPPAMRWSSSQDHAPAPAKVKLIRKLLTDPEVEEVIDRDFVAKAAHDPALVSRVRRSYEEHHPRPEKPEPPAGIRNMVWENLGANLYGGVYHRQQEIRDFAAYLQQRGPDLSPDERQIVTETIEDLDQTKRLIDQYQDILRGGLGISINETFERLTRES